MIVTNSWIYPFVVAMLLVAAFGYAARSHEAPPVAPYMEVR